VKRPNHTENRRRRWPKKIDREGSKQLRKRERRERRERERDSSVAKTENRAQKDFCLRRSNVGGLRYVREREEREGGSERERGSERRRREGRLETSNIKREGTTGQGECVRGVDSHACVLRRERERERERESDGKERERKSLGCVDIRKRGKKLRKMRK